MTHIDTPSATLSTAPASDVNTQRTPDQIRADLLALMLKAAQTTAQPTQAAEATASMQSTAQS